MPLGPAPFDQIVTCLMRPVYLSPKNQSALSVYSVSSPLLCFGFQRTQNLERQRESSKPLKLSEMRGSKWHVAILGEIGVVVLVLPAEL